MTTPAISAVLPEHVAAMTTCLGSSVTGWTALLHDTADQDLTPDELVALAAKVGVALRAAETVGARAPERLRDLVAIADLDEGTRTRGLARLRVLHTSSSSCLRSHWVLTAFELSAVAALAEGVTEHLAATPVPVAA